jgi:hypothetical protein
MSACNTPRTHCLSQQSVCSAPNSSRKHKISSSHCLMALQTMAGTPALPACGRRESSRSKSLSARAEYDATVRFVEGTNLHSACASGPNDTAGNEVVSTSLAKSTAARCCSSGLSLYESCSRCCREENDVDDDAKLMVLRVESPPQRLRSQCTNNSLSSRARRCPSRLCKRHSASKMSQRGIENTKEGRLLPCWLALNFHSAP